MGHPADLSECSRYAERAVAVGVDVGAGGVTAVVADGRGHVISRLERALPQECDSDGRRLAAEVCEIIVSLRASVAELAGQAAGQAGESPAVAVGVCVPGVIDEDEGRVVRSDALGLHDVPLASLVSQCLQKASQSAQVALYQDARCGAWAESRWGAGGESCLYLSVADRISCAVLLNGIPVLGDGWAGQVGRVLVPDPDWSGERARLEDVASVEAMVRRYTAGIVDDAVDDADTVGGKVESTADSVESAGSPCARIDSLLGAMRSGDREARRVWDTGLDALADLVARGAGLLGPLDVVVSSELTSAGEAVFLEPLRQRIIDLMAGLPVPSLLPAELGKPAPALGAAGRALEG